MSAEECQDAPSSGALHLAHIMHLHSLSAAQMEALINETPSGSTVMIRLNQM